MINKQYLEQYNSIDWNKLVRKDLGEYSLEESEENLKRIKNIFDSIINFVGLDRLPQNLINTIDTQLNSFIQFTNSLLQHNNTTQSKTLVNQIINKEFEVFQSLSGIINYIDYLDPTKHVELKEKEREYEDTTKKLQATFSAVSSLLDNTKKKVVKAEIQEYGNFFGTEAEENESRAKNSFLIMLASIIITGIVAIIFLQSIHFEINAQKGFWENLLTTINSQNILIKFVVISLGVYLISHFSKVHSAEKHLYNINIQRQNALNSHKQILDSVIATESDNEKEIRNAILLELTKAIFESKDTGYIKNSEKNSITVNPSLKV